MKKLILFGVVLVLVLSSCANFSPELLDPEAYENQNIDYQPKTFDEAWKWIAQNITYKKGELGNDKQTPEQTYALRTGDCDDYAILLAYWGFKLGIDVKLIGINRDDYGNHVVIQYNGEWIEPRCYGFVWNQSSKNIHKIAEYTYHDAFYNYFYQ